MSQLNICCVMLNHIIKMMKFAAVSGMGLGIDFAVFLALVGFGFSPFGANIASGGCAVTFVYFVSVRRIFSYQGKLLLGLFFAYLLYQVLGVTAASLAVGYLSDNFTSAALSKILILPVTFTANYLFMALLTRVGPVQPLAPAAGAAGNRGRN